MPNGRYLVEISALAPTPEVAITFVMNNLENRAMGLFTQETVSGVITSAGQPLVQENTALTSDITSFGDIQRRGNTPIVTSNNVSLAGGHITAGRFDVTGTTGNYIPFVFALNGGTNAAQDTVGRQPLVLLRIIRC